MSEKFVLVIPSHDAALSEYVKVFKRKLGVSPIFYLGYESNLVNELQACGFICITKKNITNNTDKIKKVLINIFKVFLDKTSIGCFIQKNLLLNRLVRNKINQIKKKSDELEIIISQYGIRTCLLASDRSSGVEASVYFLAKKIELKTVVLSFAYSADFISSYKLREAKIYKNAIPSSNNVYVDEVLGSRTFFRPFEEFALTRLGVFPNNPWVLGSGCCDFMLLESDREKERLIRLGGDASKYITTGAASHDDLYNSLLEKKSINDALIKKYQLSYDRNIVISLPQYFEHGLCEKKLHFQYIEDLLYQLSDLNFNLIISLHPKMNLDNYIYLKSKFQIVILEESLSNVIVVADIFLATYSSTIAWALMCQIPVVIFDHIGLNYSDFYSEFDFKVVKDNLELKAEVEHKIDLLSSISSENEVKNLSPFDGACVDRIVCLLASGDE